MRRSISFALLLCVFAAAAACGSVYRRPVDITPAAQRHVTTPADGELRDVVLVGNNWSGTVTAFDPASFDTLTVIDVVPDWDERIADIKKSTARKAAFSLIRK